jgi:hypothetical protein
MAAATTSFFHVLSDDDVILPDFFETAMATLEKHPQVGSFSGATIHANLENEISDVPLAGWRDEIYQPPQGMLEIIRVGHPDFTATLFRREVLQEVGGLNGTVTFSDVEFLCRCAAHYPIAISTTPCGVYFIHPSSTGSVRAGAPYSVTSIAAWMEIVESIQSLETVSEGDRQIAKAMMLARLSKPIFFRGLKAAAAGHRSNAQESAELLRKSFRKTIGPLFIEVLAALSIEPIAKVLTPIVEMVRRERAQRLRNNLTDHDHLRSYACALKRVSKMAFSSERAKCLLTQT